MRPTRVPPPQHLEPDARQRIILYVTDELEYPQMLPELKAMWRKCRDTYAAKGELRINWEAQFRLWLQREKEYWQANGNRKPDPQKAGPAQRGSREMPEETRSPHRRNLRLVRNLLNKDKDNTNE